MAITLAQAISTLTQKGAPFEMESRRVRGVDLRCWKHAPRTIRELVLGMLGHGDQIYLVYEDERLSYRESFERIAGLAHSLVEDFGIQKGDRVAIAMRNYPEWAFAFWAVCSLGAVVVPLNAWWTGHELAYGLLDSGTKLVIADSERAERIRPHLIQLAVEAVLIVRAEPEAKLEAPSSRFEHWLSRRPGVVELPSAAIEPDDDATIFYTSGTTGKPKGALGSHLNLVTSVASIAFGRTRGALRKGTAVPQQGSAAPQVATLVTVPLFHVMGSHSLLGYTTGSGGKLVLMERWNAERALELIERERITNLGGVPSMIWQVLESPDLRRRDTSSLLGLNYGGAPAAPELMRRVRQALPASTPSNGYGLTETSAGTSSNSGPDYDEKPDSVGTALPICDVKVVDPAGRELPNGEIGELWIRGPNVVKGYWNKPEATAESFTDGWLHSGDLAHIDGEGFIFIVDRAKDMLIRGGENVYCVEVENVLYQHPDVIDAAVIGLPHRLLGEEVCAVVQLTSHSTTTADALRAHAAQYLAAFKVPVRIEIRTEPLPRNANGKILKRQLKDEVLGTR
jgi:long-chain acyl-CoA synthetase